MPVPLPSAQATKLTPPDADEVAAVARGVATAVAPEGGLTGLQVSMINAITESMTGIAVDCRDVEPLSAEGLAEALAPRNTRYRTRIVQNMLLAELVLVPLPEDVADRVERYAAELSVGEELLTVARDLAHGSLGLAAIDFQRAGYSAAWDDSRCEALHTSRALSDAWEQTVHDPALAERWAALEHCPDGSLGRDVWRFYTSRGFRFPGTPGSAPPLLAQHDWVHVIADYGTKVENEIEVFAFIARANDDPRGFSLLAMVISLFETGYLATGAGLFQYDRGHLSGIDGMTVRLADAMYRGATCGGICGGLDLLAVDWFEHADRPVREVREWLGAVPKSAAALAAGSVGPFEPGSMSSYQMDAARALAIEQGREHLTYGASV